MQNNTKIFVWSPFISKVGVVNNVINNAYSLIKFSKLRKFKISLINSFGEWNNFQEDLLEKKINIINFFNFNFFRKFKKGGFLKSRLSYIFIFFTSFFPLLKILKKEKPDYLTAHLITSLPLILFTFFNFRTKLILNIAGYPKINIFRKFLWKKSSSKIFIIICPSNELKEKLVELNIFDYKKIFVVQDPHINIKTINKLKSIKIDDEFFDNSKIIISIGRLTKQKNFHFLITNFNELVKKYDNLKLVIIGDGEEKYSLVRLIKKLNLEKKIKIAGYKKNIYNYLYCSDFYVSTSRWEGSSLSMIDAAFIALPILCSDCPTGRKEFIDNNKRGYLFLNDNKADFLNKFDLMFNANKSEIRSQLIEAKKETKKFTLFKHYLNFNNII